MIMIGGKINGAIPSTKRAIAERDAELTRERVRVRAAAGC
jgi:hypothetical protein